MITIPFLYADDCLDPNYYLNVQTPGREYAFAGHYTSVVDAEAF